MSESGSDTDTTAPPARIDDETRSRDEIIAELRRSEASLKARLEEFHGLVNRNPTTGLPIRRVFDRDFQRALAAAAATPRGPHIAVGLIRLDAEYTRIKNTRDKSRALLYRTADRIREIIGDNIYQSDRLDEFILILRDMPNEDGLELRTDQIVEAIREPHAPPADDVRFGCHLGVAMQPMHGTASDELLGNADIALTESERTNTSCVVYDDAMGARFRERAEIEVEMKASIQEGFTGFQLNYQPFVDMQGRIVGSEALLRWTHPRLGPVPPTKFIPVAEESDAVRFIGQWTLYHACRQLKLWHKAGHPDLYVSVNVSPAQFKQHDLVERVESVLESTRLEGRFLTLELTETTVMDDPDEAISTMERFRALGVKLALDDFGTGYSSLAYLRRFHFDTLKIDRSFVTDVDRSAQAQEIVRAIVAMGHAFGMKTLAEGVERREELDFVTAQGCNLIQGYIYSAPLVGEKLGELLDLTASGRGWGLG